MSADAVRVSVRVKVPPARAFRLFTEEIDRWWRRGPRFRGSGARWGVLHLEPFVGGRLYESVAQGERTVVLETGRVTAWEPPHRLVLDWRNLNFREGEVTEIEVTFAPQGEDTLVTVVHRGWEAIRADHPARHGLDPRAFCRMMGLWWGDLMTALREHAALTASGSPPAGR
ncbi:MAG: SRPBCC domain-containing protein [Alphaproteobacteria bacterium]|nr:SRPBCC domain-containing protein [Alphaproteobacteria bacterium]